MGSVYSVEERRRKGECQKLLFVFKFNEDSGEVEDVVFDEEYRRLVIDENREIRESGYYVDCGKSLQHLKV